MSSFFSTTTFVLLLSQLVFLIALRSEVIIYRLDSLESQPSGITKTLNLKNSETQLDISVFGWIKMTYLGTFKEILEVKGISKSENDLENPRQDLIFCLQYLNWGTSKLKLCSFLNLKEEVSYFELSPEEQNTWIFVYFGHSFQILKQTYYLKSRLKKQLVTKPVPKIENAEFCQISTGVGQYDGKEYIQGKIERLTVQTGQGAYKESDFADFLSFHPDNVTGCAIGYDQCGYIGQPFDLCRGGDKPKSVLLQGMDSVMICVNHREIKVKKNIVCIDDAQMINLLMADAIDFSDDPNGQCNNK